MFLKDFDTFQIFTCFLLLLFEAGFEKWDCTVICYMHCMNVCSLGWPQSILLYMKLKVVKDI